VLEFPVGIILLVRPRINADGKITMRIHPVVSTITSIGAGNIPNTSNREAETTVMVNDGETIVIGGLIRDEFTKSLQEVPILSRLPLVGELFKFRSNSRRRSEVQVFITPHLNATGAPLTAVERNNAAATTVEQTHLSIPPPPRSGLPRDPHGELPQTRKP
jgi:type II secretory pathway component GspD/PulD (secretin)